MPGELTSLLQRWGEGDRDAVADLIPLVYQELQAMARGYLRHERRGHTLQPTALVHEAYLRLIGMDSVRWESRAQFFSIAARVLRHILVDYARERGALKRGAGERMAPLEAALTVPAGENIDLVGLDQSLERLAAVDPRKARVVELRYFGGLSIEEVAEVMDSSPMTVKRDWSFARAWLFRDLGG